jgi:hypothetical protein
LGAIGSHGDDGISWLRHGRAMAFGEKKHGDFSHILFTGWWFQHVLTILKNMK